MAEVYVGNLDPKTTTSLIVHELEFYGEILSVKIPRSSSVRRYAFVQFKHRRDAQFAIHSWNSKFNWRLEFSRNSMAASNSIKTRETRFGANNCHTCGASGHFARNCPSGHQKDIKSKGVKKSQRGRRNKNQVASTQIWKPVSPPWVELPEDITAKILHMLGPVWLLVSAQKVCSSWRKICRDPAMWRVIDMWKLGVRGKFPYDYNVALCRLAVDLSQGLLTEINIEDFGNYDLLEYILERCGHLRCLRFAFCDDLSFKSLSKSKVFPQLEELHIHYNPIKKDDIEAIGRSFPMLKTFALNYPACDRGLMEKSTEALPVTTFMPELRHLELIGNEMTNDVLEAILNGCPKLESLDLRCCYSLHLEGELGKRCAQQIKVLRHPRDPTKDYVWDDIWPTDNVPNQDAYHDSDDSDPDYDDYCDPLQFGGDLDYDDFYDPFQFHGGSEDEFVLEYFL